jgi:alkylation response protein AidB-like acyl-CoA dehydrogenase
VKRLIKGTTYVVFEDVKVPVENIIGQENKGFKAIMFNFNHERMGICIQATRFARVCFEDSIKYAHKRKTFGKNLIDHPVIRNKLAHMARKIEATHAWMEALLFQTIHMPEEMQMLKLGGPIALLKAQSTQTMEFCAREAAQIFGGLSYSRGGFHPYPNPKVKENEWSVCTERYELMRFPEALKRSCWILVFDKLSKLLNLWELNYNA